MRIRHGTRISSRKTDSEGRFRSLNRYPDEIQGYAQTLFAAVARRAYELFESRGLVHGYDRDDWYRAESELVDPINVELSDSR